MSLTVQTINHRRPVVKPTLSRREARALEEVEQFYGPNSVLRLLTTYFRSGPGAELLLLGLLGLSLLLRRGRSAA